MRIFVKNISESQENCIKGDLASCNTVHHVCPYKEGTKYKNHPVYRIIEQQQKCKLSILYREY